MYYIQTKTQTCIRTTLFTLEANGMKQDITTSR